MRKVNQEKYNYWLVRAIVLALLKCSVYFIQITYLFYFTSSFLHRTNIILSILNIYFNKIFILLHFKCIMAMTRRERKKKMKMKLIK